MAAKKKVIRKKKTTNGHAPDENVVTLADLAKDLKMAPAAARRKLRAAGLKAEGRWQWKKGSNELKRIEKALIATAE